MAWTLEQLAERAARALVDAEVRVANGRVTGVPDGRVIRWYATIGLVDRPLSGPGRGARYGTRHLLQLVAVKRLQAQGLPLAEIQHRLAGATDATLRRIAALPLDLDEPGDADATADADAMEVLRRPADRSPARNMPESATPNGGVSPQDAPAGVATSARFWAERLHGRSASSPEPARVDTGPVVDTEGQDVSRVYGVGIRGLTLLLPAEPTEDDLDAIAAAAQPLLELLADRDLLNPPTT